MKEAHSLQAGFPVSNDCKSDDINKTYAMPPQSDKPLFAGCRCLGLQLRYGLETVRSVTQARKPWFFCALPEVFLFGRGGAYSIQDLSKGRYARRSVAVSNTPIALESNHLEKHTGEHNHA